MSCIFSIDFIDRTAHPTAATPTAGEEVFEARYPWFSDSLVPYDSMYFTANVDRPELPLGKSAGHMNTFNIPSNKIITQFYKIYVMIDVLPTLKKMIKKLLVNSKRFMVSNSIIMQYSKKKFLLKQF